MLDYKYDYTIWRDNSPERFKQACEIIENAFPDICKNELLIDVDGSTIQVYIENGKEIVVYDDYDVGAVYALSEVDLEGLFPVPPYLRNNQ